MNFVLTSKEGKYRAFWTNAKECDIRHIINNNKERYDLIRNHDKHLIKHNLDWVKYHLIRSNFVIRETKRNIPTILIDNVPLMHLRKVHL